MIFYITLRKGIMRTENAILCLLVRKSTNHLVLVTESGLQLSLSCSRVIRVVVRLLCLHSCISGSNVETRKASNLDSFITAADWPTSFAARPDNMGCKILLVEFLNL